MSLNDPQWGKRGNDGGPPDLDEIWRNVNRRMGELFGRKGDDGGGGGTARRAGAWRWAARACSLRWCWSFGWPAASISSTKAAEA